MPLTPEQKSEINHQQHIMTETRRVSVQTLEDILYHPIDVLDHGFIRVIDYMGDQISVVQAARISYGHGTKGSRSDRALIHYLMRHGHTTPFEMCEIKLHVKLPIFVARQWIRHRTASINEMSGRYSLLGAEWYHPTHENLGGTSDRSNNRQGRGTPLSSEKVQQIQTLLKQNTQLCYETYRHLVDDLALAREVARILLPMNLYTHWYWKIDLHNLLHFLSLRLKENAQYEIRAYAEVILDIIKKWVPLIYEAFCIYRLESVCFSALALKVVHRLLAGETVTQENSGLSKGEWCEIMSILKPHSEKKQNT